MLIEPTESESLEELDRRVYLGIVILLIIFQCRFCESMIAIHQEAQEVISGQQPKDNNVLKNSPHPYSTIALDDKEWDRLVL